MKRNFFFVCFILIAGWICASPTIQSNERQKYNFNSQWELHVGDFDNTRSNYASDLKTGKFKGEWKSVTLPAAFNEDEAFRLSIAEHTDTIVWYRKEFRLPASAKNKKIFLEFEGIRFGGEFFLNGQSIGLHENGVMAFGFDISDLVNYAGKNILMARIDNSWRYRERSTQSTYQWNDRNFYANFGGIPKNVFLHVTQRLYQTLPLYSNLKTTGTYIYAREIDITDKSAQVFAEAEIRNEFSESKDVYLEVSVEDIDGKTIRSFRSPSESIQAGETRTLKAGSKINDLNFWSWGYGYLYTVYTTLYVDNKAIDVVKTRTGFRKTRFANGLFWLNDRVLQVKGFAERSTNEWPAQGLSVPAWLSDYSNRLMVESNANTVRWMHVTPWKQDVESCDRVGLIQLLPAGDAERDVEGRRWEQRVELMRDAIIYNRNNPSVIFYEGGNESISEEHMADLKAVRDLYDPYGGRAIGSREMLDSKIAEWGGEMLYINKSAKHPMFATEYCRDESLRSYWDNYSYPFHQNGEGVRYVPEADKDKPQRVMDYSPYNRNQDTFFKELITRWWDYYRVRPGTGKRVSSGGLKIQFHEVNSHWRGTENYRRSGIVDAMRVPKEVFYAHQIMWNGWVDIEQDGTHIFGHWQQPLNKPEPGGSPTPRASKEVLVVSSGDKVELLVNGKSQGFGTRSDGFLFTFEDVKWEPGKVEAISYDLNGKVLSRAYKETVGEPDRITLKMMQAPDGFKADGSDLVLIEIEVVDKEGRRCPNDYTLLDFNLTGAAEWRGGIAHGKFGNYVLEKQLPVENGINRVLVRSTTKAGKVKLVVSALENKKLKPVSIEFSSRKVDAKNGLSAYITGDHQPSNLERGATPTTPSFTVKRHSVDIVAATAGSNEEDVANSFDDNELSEWRNDGTLANGWIKYELEQDATVSEVDLKLTGWRMRSYPIEIYVGNTKVWEGETPKSLGYVNIPFEPTRGRFVTIQLTGANKDQDAFGGIVEVEAETAGELDLFKDPNAANSKGQLRVVEADIYHIP